MPNPFRDSRTGIRGELPACAPRWASFRLLRCTLIARLTKNNAHSHSLALSLGLDAFFSLALARPASILLAQMVSRTLPGSPWTFKLFRNDLPLEASISRHQHNTCRNGTRHISGLQRMQPKTFKFGSTGASDRAWRHARLPLVSRQLSEAVLGCPERSWNALGPRGDPQGRCWQPQARH